MSARVTLDSPGFEGRLRYQHRSSSYLRRSVLNGQPQQQIFDIITPARRTNHGAHSVQKAHIPHNTHAPMRAPATPMRTHQITSIRHTAASHRSRKRRGGSNKQALVMYLMAIVLFTGGSYVALNGLLTNRHVEAQVRTLSKQQAPDGSGPVVPSTEKPASHSIASYTVAPNMPRYIDIPTLKQHARVVKVGLKSDGSIAAPGNVYDVGWYNKSSLPGKAGAMLIDGHVSSWTAHGTLYDIKKLKAGDVVKIERGDGKVFTYKVVKSQLFDYRKVDMASAVKSADAHKPGLNMITCAGKVIPGTNEFDKRLIVYAVQQ